MRLDVSCILSCRKTLACPPVSLPLNTTGRGMPAPRFGPRKCTWLSLHVGQVRESDPWLAEVIQLLARTQQHQVHSALHRVPAGKTRDVALDAECAERAFRVRLGAILVDGLRELTDVRPLLIERRSASRFGGVHVVPGEDQAL